MPPSPPAPPRGSPALPPVPAAPPAGSFPPQAAKAANTMIAMYRMLYRWTEGDRRATDRAFR
jgi:hypothetical protein